MRAGRVGLLLSSGGLRRGERSRRGRAGRAGHRVGALVVLVVLVAISGEQGRGWASEGERRHPMKAAS